MGVLGSIPSLARQEGFDGTVIMGIWDPSSQEEWNNALEQTPFVDGYCLGNEGLGVRYSMDELEAKMAALKRSTRRPVTTTEPIDSYLQGPYREWLLTHSDWIFPLAHPFWAEQVDPQHAVNWIVSRHDYLVATTGRRVVLKEAGFPSGGLDGYNEASQLAFFQNLEATGIPFFYFEAFDQPWKRDILRYHEVEAHWGLYRTDGTQKQVALWLVKQRSKR
jgi:exo-beta-1,3-glucanase (GH17 family)